MKFNGRTAVVTGAGSPRGFGRLIALMLADRGCNIMVWDLDGEGAAETARLCAQYGVRTASLAVDVSNEDQVNFAAAETLRIFSRVDILVNNAGITQKKTLLEISLDEWNRMQNINMTSIFLACKAFLPSMIAQKYGRIVNTSSVSGRNGGGVFGGSHYCASKAAVIGFSKALAKEVATTGVTVNCVAPGASKTDIGGNKFENKPHPTGVPMDRRGEPREIASAVLFLASEDASFITGHTIDINGGSYMV